MPFRVVFSDIALKRLKKLDKPTAALIIGYVEKNLEGCSDPRIHGKALTANHRGKWRYRVGDYRLLALIEDDRVLVTVVEIGHRSDVYRD
jgi:mRNA interferase RelE/StbE